MAARRPTVLASPSASVRSAALALAVSVATALPLGGCESDPTTVLQTDLPQIPGMAGRESSGLRQAGSVVESGTFAYKGAVPDLRQRVDETKSRFAAEGWLLRSERMTQSTARIEFTKGNRRATVEVIRNDISPGMSTAVTTVKTDLATEPKP